MDEPAFRRAFAKRLRQARALAGQTQAHLAERVDVSEKYISHLENALSTPSAFLVFKLSKAVDSDLTKDESTSEDRNSPALRRLLALLDGHPEQDMDMLRRVATVFFKALASARQSPEG